MWAYLHVATPQHQHYCLLQRFNCVIYVTVLDNGINSCGRILLHNSLCFLSLCLPFDGCSLIFFFGAGSSGVWEICMVSGSSLSLSVTISPLYMLASLSCSSKMNASYDIVNCSFSFIPISNESINFDDSLIWGHWWPWVFSAISNQFIWLSCTSVVNYSGVTSSQVVTDCLSSQLSPFSLLLSLKPRFRKTALSNFSMVVRMYSMWAITSSTTLLDIFKPKSLSSLRSTQAKSLENSLPHTPRFPFWLTQSKQWFTTTRSRVNAYRIMASSHTLRALYWRKISYKAAFSFINPFCKTLFWSIWGQSLHSLCIAVQ